MRHRRLAWMLIAAATVTLSACGSSSSGSGSGSSSKPSLTVSAASSLTKAFTAYGNDFPQAQARFSFAGSDMLAAQIEQGVKPDVFASANTSLPDTLYAKRLVAKPVVFATNTLVIAVPAGSKKVSSIADLAKPGVSIAIGSPSVPVGSYTRMVLAKLPAAERKAILANVRSEEPDVNGVIGKLTQAAADAGFVYITDVDATAGKTTAIQLPATLKPNVAYAAAVVNGSAHPTQSQAFIAGLLSGPGQQELQKAGFGPPPK